MKRLASVILTLTCSIIFAAPAHAEPAPQWQTGTSRVSAAISTDRPPEFGDDDRLPGCKASKEYVPGVIQSVDMCVVQSDVYSLAIIASDKQVNSQTYWSMGRLHIRVGTDKIFYPIKNMSRDYNKFYIAENPSDLIYMHYKPYDYGLYAEIYSNFALGLRVIKTELNGRSTQVMIPAYEFTNPAPKPLTYEVPLTQRENLLLHAHAVSDNGCYIIGDTWRETVRIDTRDGTVRKISRDHGWQYSGSQSVLAISDDGTKALLSGTHSSFRILHIPESCGESANCDTVDQYPDLIRGLSAGSQYEISPQRAKFDDSYAISLVATYANKYWNIDLQASGYVQPAIEYLALGDSYSSGEGDVGRAPNGGSYYFPVTAPQDECHLSTRSYPFLLAQHYGILNQDMRSIACSGAKINDDYLAGYSSYLGQGGRLKELSAAKREEEKQSALITFRPGRVPQLEFVKKYKPKTITLTGGGNDVGFVEILNYCVGVANSKNPYDICPYADFKSEQRKILVDAIMSQRTTLTKTIQKIRSYSPDTKIIIIGYPNFFGNVRCSDLRSGFSRKDEQEMMVQSIHLLNNVLRSTAKNNNATFIDIENSLIDGGICGNSKYMTNLGDISIRKYRSIYLQELFHPNAAGHAKMAEAIIASGKFNTDSSDNSVDDTPEVAGITTTIPFNLTGGIAAASMPAGGGVIYANIPTNLRTPIATWQPNSSITIQIFSEPQTLGTFTASSEGALSASPTIPANLEPGIHLIVASGTSFSGEPLRLYQYVTVAHSETDYDGDGIANADDPCPTNTALIAAVGLLDQCAQTAEPPSVTAPSSNISSNSGNADIAKLSTTTEPLHPTSILRSNEQPQSIFEQPHSSQKVSTHGSKSPLDFSAVDTPSAHSQKDDTPAAHNNSMLLLAGLLVFAIMLLARILYAKKTNKKE